MSAQSADEAKKLTSELAELSNKQSEAMKTAAYLIMSEAEAIAFNERYDRIGKIRQLLGETS